MARKSRKKSENSEIIKPVVWQMALYARLSNEQDSLLESASISSQRKLLRNHVENHPDMIVANEYIDDGMTGTTFQRSAFSRMINAIIAGEINGVIVKDFSRFGRNFEESEEYLLKIFPFLNVRFIAVNDDFDSAYMEADIITIGMKNLVNDYYAKDVSQKVGSSIKLLRQEGMYWGPRPPYGFLIKNDKELRYLVKDPKTEPYVQQIFDKFEAGESCYQIVKWLEVNHAVPPMCRSYELGLLKNSRYKHLTKWHRSTLVNILRNPVYYGAIAIAKSERSLWNNIPYRKLSPDEWVCISNTHKGYISKEQYLSIQMSIEKRALKAQEKINIAEKETRVCNLFTRKIYCGVCKRPLTRKYFRTRKGKRSYYFTCGNHFNKATPEPCPSIYMQERHVEKEIFELLKGHIKHISDAERIISERQRNLQSNKVDSYTTRLERVNTSISDKEQMKKELYLDWKREFLAEDEYLYMRDEYSAELELLQQEKVKAQKEVNRFCKEPNKVYPLVDGVKEFINSLKLDDKLMQIFIKRIEVYQNQKMEIQLHTTDAFLELLYTMEGLNEI